MRKFRSLLALILAVLLLAGCSGRKGKSTENDTDYLAVIRQDLYGQDTELGRVMERVVGLKIDKVEGDRITVTVTAPDVCDEILSWFEGVSDEDFTEEALNQKLLSLLEGKKISAQFTLELQDGNILYTNDFLNAASCGVRRFYTALEVMLMEEMEESIDD